MISTKPFVILFLSVLMAIGYSCNSDTKFGELVDEVNYCDTLFSRQHVLSGELMPDSVRKEIERYVEQLQPIKDEAAVALSKCMILLVNDIANRGDFIAANELLFKMEELLNQEHLRDTCFMLAETYSFLGYNYMQLYQLEKAALYSEKAIFIYKNTNTWSQVVTEHARQALIYSISGGLEKARDAGNRALSLCDSLGMYGEEKCLDAQNSLGNTYVSLGEAYLSEGKRVLAFEAFEESIALFKAVTHKLEQIEPVPPIVGLLYANIGLSYAFLGYKDEEYLQEAKDYLEQGEAIVSKNPGGYNLENKLVNLKFYLAGIYNKLGRYDKGLSKHGEVMSLLMKGLEDTPQHRWESFPNHPNQYSFITAANTKGQIYKASYNKKKDIKQLKKALVNSKEAIEMINYFIQTEISEIGMITQRAKMESSFSEAVHTASLLYRITEQPKYFEEAFNIAEQHKAYAIRTGLYQKMNKSIGAGPLQQLIEQDLDFTRQSRELKSRLQAALRGDEQQVILDAIIDLKKKKEKFLKHLEKSKKPLEYKYFKDRYSDAVSSFAAIKEELVNEDRALIEYHLGGHHPLAFVITESGQHIVELEIPDDFYEKLSWITDTGLNKDIQGAIYDDYKEVAHDVYQSLLGKVIPLLPEEVEELLIVSDNQARELPFEALVVDQDESGQNGIHYLLHDYSISYLYSAAAYVLQKERYEHQPSQGKKMIAAYDASITKSQVKTEIERLCNTWPLPNMSDGAKSMLKLFPDETTLFISEADKATFIRTASEYNILHLVMHGCTDAVSSLDYYLQFQPSESSELQPGLTVNEIYDLDLNAELAVLASCNTERGQLTRGEGTASIARAFTIAGCKNLITSLNPINDKASAEIYNSFYKQLINEGVNTSIALTRAKRAYLSNPDIESKYKSPRLWANIILLGKPTHIKIE